MKSRANVAFIGEAAQGWGGGLRRLIQSVGRLLMVTALAAALFLSTRAAVEAACYDVNGSGKVDTVDISMVRAHFLTTDPLAIPRFDLNGDGNVNGIDISMVRSQFSLEC